MDPKDQKDPQKRYWNSEKAKNQKYKLPEKSGCHFHVSFLKATTCSDN